LRFTETVLKGAFLIQLERKQDSRGFFARTFCQREFAEHGLDTQVAQCNVSFNPRKGTLRGMHYQAKPYEEAKVVRCTMGRIYDVIIDLRRESPTFKKSFGVELTAQDHNMLYVPRGFGHGFQTLENDAEIFYQISEFYSPDHQRGVRWNDPAFGIEWPPDERIISERDQNYPDFR
jgi:dTDP-4-dehydrorhamnose 3,5-epimerase